MEYRRVIELVPSDIHIYGQTWVMILLLIIINELLMIMISKVFQMIPLDQPCYAKNTDEVLMRINICSDSFW